MKIMRAALRVAAVVWVVSSPLAIPMLACLQCCVDHGESGEPVMPVAEEHATPACHRAAESAPSSKPNAELKAVCYGPVSAFLAALTANGVATPRAIQMPPMMAEAAVLLPVHPIHSSTIDSDSPPPRS